MGSWGKARGGGQRAVLESGCSAWAKQDEDQELTAGFSSGDFGDFDKSSWRRGGVSSPTRRGSAQGGAGGTLEATTDMHFEELDIRERRVESIPSVCSEFCRLMRRIW